jgi:hypothetical protein
MVDADDEQGDVVFGVLADDGLDDGVADLCRRLLLRLGGEAGGQLVDAVVKAAGACLDQAVGVQQQGPGGQGDSRFPSARFQGDRAPTTW